MAELWNVAILMVLFWGYVNGTTPVGEAKRLYCPLMFALSLAAVAGGWLTSWAAKLQNFEVVLKTDQILDTFFMSAHSDQPRR